MNIAHIIETALMILVVFLLGAILGYVIRHLFFRPKAQTASPATTRNPATIPKVATAPAAPQTTAAKPASIAPKTAATANNNTDNTATDGSKPVTLSKPRDGKKDDLKRIKGIGPKIENTLNGLGIYHFNQIEQWTPKNIEWINGFIKFKDRIQREKWIDQAQKLAAGEATEFSKRVDKGDVPSSKK